MAERFLHRELSYTIIGAAMEVHRLLGPGFLESVYEEALDYEFKQRSLVYRRQAELAVHYKDKIIGKFLQIFWWKKRLLLN